MSSIRRYILCRKKKIKEHRFKKELEREERKRRRDARKINDMQKRIQEKEHHQKYLEQLRSKTKSNEWKTLKEKQKIIEKKQIDDTEIIASNRKMNRFRQKELRKQYLNQQYREIDLN
jgi:hypothetical protein